MVKKPHHLQKELLIFAKAINASNGLKQLMHPMVLNCFKVTMLLLQKALLRQYSQMNP